MAPVVAWRFTLSHPLLLLHHRYAEAIEIFIGSTFCDQVGTVSNIKISSAITCFFSPPYVSQNHVW